MFHSTPGHNLSCLCGSKWWQPKTFKDRTEGLEWVDLETTRQGIYRMVTWISLDLSTFYAYHIISLCLCISYDIILWYVVADDVDATCCFLFVAGTFVISFSMIEQKQSIRAWMGFYMFGTNFNQRLDAVCLLIVVPKWKRTVLPKWKRKNVLFEILLQVFTFEPFGDAFVLIVLHLVSQCFTYWNRCFSIRLNFKPAHVL